MIAPTTGTAADLARALGAQRNARGWMARCPAHDDRNPSLSIADGADGRILVTCFAGCSWMAIRDALQARSLWPSRNAHGIESPRPPPSGDLHVRSCSKLDHELAFVRQHLARGDRRIRHVGRDLSAKPVSHRTRAADPALRLRCGIGRAVSCAALHGRRGPGRRWPPQRPAPHLPAARTAAARRTCSRPRRCWGAVVAAPCGSLLQDDGLPFAKASRPA